MIRALDYRSGAARPEEVGIDVPDDYILRFRLEKPYPAFMNAMVTGSMFPIHRESLAKYGDEWHKLEHYQGNAPYRIVEWELNSHIILEPNPLYNLPRGNLERIDRRFAGRPLESYQSNEVDFSVLWLESSIADIHYAKQHPVLLNEMVWTPTSGLSFIRFLFSENPVYWDPRVRRAFSMAFDKHRIVKAVFLGREVPVDLMSSPAMPDYDSTFENPYNLEETRRLLGEAGYPGGKGFPTSVILIPSYLRPAMISQFVVIATMLEENLGIRVKIDNQELGVYADKRASLNKPDYVGMCFSAMGAPWPDPVYGTYWSSAEVVWTDSVSVYGRWWEGQRRFVQISTGMIQLEGGKDIEEFKAFQGQILSYEDSVLALYADGKHGPYLRKEAKEMMRGWEWATGEILNKVQAPNADLDRLWKEMNLTLLQVRQYYFQWLHTSDLRWKFEEMRRESLYERERAKQAAINREAHRILLDYSRDIPLHVMKAVALVKPYVKGLRFCPYWWGNPLYMKWVSFEDDEPAGSIETVKAD